MLTTALNFGDKLREQAHRSQKRTKKLLGLQFYTFEHLTVCKQCSQPLHIVAHIFIILKPENIQQEEGVSKSNSVYSPSRQ